MSGRITTHVLDTARGRPAAGIPIELYCENELIATAVTNADGRTDAPLVSGDDFGIGAYSIIFSVGDYFELERGRKFLSLVPVWFIVLDAAENYHVPLLISPFGYTTYRGS